MIEAQIARLRPEEQRVLEVASVAGRGVHRQRLRGGRGPGARGR